MLALIIADDEAGRAAALDQRDLDTVFGRKVVARLDSLLALRRRGRANVALPRHGEGRGRPRQRAPRRLNINESALLERLYRGAAQIDQSSRVLLVNAFVQGYDRPHGVIRIPLEIRDGLQDALLASGCLPHEIVIRELPTTATVRVGADNRTNRGFIWAMLMVAAVHKAAQ